MRSQHGLLEQGDNMEASRLDGPPTLQDHGGQKAWQTEPATEHRHPPCTPSSPWKQTRGKSHRRKVSQTARGKLAEPNSLRQSYKGDLSSWSGFLSSDLCDLRPPDLSTNGLICETGAARPPQDPPQ